MLFVGIAILKRALDGLPYKVVFSTNKPVIK